MPDHEASRRKREKYIDDRFAFIDERHEELSKRVDGLASAEEPVEVPLVLAEFVRGKREEGVSDDDIMSAVFVEFGLAPFSDRQIAAALQPAPQTEGDEPSESDPGDELGSDEVPGE